ncbi:MAG TPA: GGDEF domain-containing protein [Gammaproteobacteria bacterium]
MQSTNRPALTAQTLAQQFLFEGERPELIDWLLPHCRLQQHPAGAVLLNPQQTADRVFLILEGDVEVRVGRHGGQILTMLGAGQCVGEMSVIEGVPPSAKVIAHTDCTAIAIEGAALRTLLEDSRVFARNLLRLLARRLRHDNQLVHQSLEQQALSEQHARRDPLTGLFNRRWLDETLPDLLLQHRTQARRLSLLMLDIDHFKRYNDSAGHVAGDQALLAVANVLNLQIRDDDQAVRFGGEEFLIVLPDTGLKDAQPIAERLRLNVQQAAIVDSAGTALPGVTLSIGLAEWSPFETPEQLIARADAALYQAKHAGRNTVRLSPAPERPETARLRRLKDT